MKAAADSLLPWTDGLINAALIPSQTCAVSLWFWEDKQLGLGLISAGLHLQGQLLTLSERGGQGLGKPALPVSCQKVS